ncbi:MAG: glutamate-5-semialdehyde dehydrogenase [Chlamydiia bacterium]|nr:glutamate-5-semialdehyde dehydrogenase [Chlamydiia bacterium]
MKVKPLATRAKKAASLLSLASTKQKNEALQALVDLLSTEEDRILGANSQDVEDGLAAGLSEALIDRLSLEGRLGGIVSDLSHVIALEDPVGQRFEPKELASGLKVFKQRVPIGVIGVIYEARPNVTLDVASLCIKSGNGALLRGGSETLRTNREIVRIIKIALAQAGLPEDAVEFIDSPDRALVNEMLTLHEEIDLIIPRGGASLHRFCREHSSIPVITGGIGICHLFVDKTADLKKSLPLLYNAKTQRPTVCNALDTVLIHKEIAKEFLPSLLSYFSGSGVSFRFDTLSYEILSEEEQRTGLKAGLDDFSTEWLDLILGVRIVSGLDEAIEHIQKHSTGHSDGILTGSEENSAKFIRQIDSACVYVNASTRFTDGSQMGLGAEVAISTQKIHARGPMALKELTSYKWVVEGDYTIRS